MWAAAAIAITFLHNPSEGWQGTDFTPSPTSTPVWNSAPSACQKSTLHAWQQFNVFAEVRKLQATREVTSAELDALGKKEVEHQKLAAQCITWNQTHYPATPRPMSEWYSDKAFVPALRDFSSFLWAQLCILAVGIVAFVLSRPSHI